MPSSTHSDQEEEDFDLGDMFPEPPRPASPPPTFASYTRPSTAEPSEWSELDIRLVGQHPLWGQHLWNAARVFATYLVEHKEFVLGKNVLELGAAGALPGIVAALSGARKTVITDYPDQSLIDNMQFNVDACVPQPSRSNVTVLGHTWGANVEPLLACLGDSSQKFDTVILSDLVFNHSQHPHLIRSCLSSTSSTSQLLVFFTHHRPKHVLADLDFFRLAREAGWECEEVLEENTGVMFEEDNETLGGEEIRAVVHGWRCWRK
ncbi:putative methyltransferase-domain-containing protein [Mrakia frigida]|uniref:putative methyltransferase-domain-containing protein n=1 Tax=Mrakia frigida TaxID=29902 RepID=UPI003FCC22B6